MTCCRPLCKNLQNVDRNKTVKLGASDSAMYINAISDTTLEKKLILTKQKDMYLHMQYN